MAAHTSPKVTPFVLLGRKRLPPEESPSSEEIYDGDRQLWVDRSSGEPLVLRMQRYAEHSRYGETTMTETREGVDQTEGVNIRASRFGETTNTATKEGIDQTEGSIFAASPFGETTMTKTREGADQTEGAPGLQVSQYGETVHTRTREGIDQTESIAFSVSPYGETTMTNTREGVDQTEAPAQTTSDAPHSHF
jgi:hypothetical protein